MKKWMLCCSAGIMAVAYFSELPGASLAALLCSVFILSVKIKNLRFIGALSLGVLWGVSYGWLALHAQLLEEDEGKDLWIEGRVVGIPSHYDYYQRFEFLVSHTSNEDGTELNRSLRKVRINWYQVNNRIEPGEYWRLNVRLKKPHGFANPGGFDYQSWLLRHEIDATGYVRSGRHNEKLPAPMSSLWGALHYFRYSIIHRLKDKLADLPSRSLLLALTVGVKDEITKEQWRVITATGTNHLFVISGLHIGFIAGCAYLAGLFLGRVTLIASPHWTAQQTAASFAIFTAIFYAFLAGFSLPTQRALVMIVVLLSGQLFKREVDIWSAYCLALLLVLLHEPLAPESKGFWLSFLAVASLIYAFNGRTIVNRFAWRWIRPQWVVFLALIPVLLVCFQQFSLMSPLANVIAVPVIGLFIVPLCLLALLLLYLAPGISEQLYALLDTILEYCLSLFTLLSKTSLLLLEFNPHFMSVLLAILGLVFLLSPRGLPAPWLGAVCLLPLFFTGGGKHAFGAYSVTILDVGQGLSVVIKTKNHSLIYDVGARYNTNFNLADAVILPYLKHVGIRQLDQVVISHSDNDHAGALPALLDKLPVDKVTVGTPIKLPALTTTEMCSSGYSWRWDGVDFQLLQASTGAWTNENNRSCVLKVGSGKQSVLLTGDIEKEAEADIISQFPDNIDASVLVVPHHGSLTSSKHKFIDWVSPEYAIFTTGYKNRFGHPHAKVIQRYHRLGITMMNTVNSGAITFTFNNGEEVPLVQEYRRTFNRYWY